MASFNLRVPISRAGAVSGGAIIPLDPATVPTPPRTVVATSGDATATVTWDVPASDGGSVITSYSIVASPGGATQTWTSGPKSKTFSGLSNGTSYTFAVAAVNSMGSSSPASSNSVTPSTSAVPGAPTGVSATASNAQAVITWVAPSITGDTAITSYTITASPGGATATWVSGPLTATMTGLTNGTAYTFTVSATNSGGTGPDSSPSSAVTPATIPSAPTSVVATGGDTTAVVTWVAPSNGGSAITSYTIVASPGGATATWTSGSLVATVTGLTNGTAYTFNVRATNAIGTGTDSSASNSVTPAPAAAFLTAIDLNGPLFHYRLNESGSSNPVDRTIHAVTASLNAPYTWSITPGPVGADTALNLTGGGYFGITRQSMTGSQTRIAFVKLSSTDSTSVYDGDAALTIYGDGSLDTWDSFGVSDGKANYRRFNGSVWQSFSSTTFVNDDAWHMIAVTYDSSTLEVIIYVDGAPDGGGFMTAHQAKGGIQYVGRGFDSGDIYDGSLGQLAVYASAVSPVDMLSIWNAAGYALFYDNFHRSNENPITTPWYQSLSWASSNKINGNVLEAVGTGVNSISLVDVAANGIGLDFKVTADYYVGSGTPYLGVLVYLDSSGNLLDFYLNGNNWGVYLVNSSGSVTATIATGSGASSGPQRLFEVTAVGDRYTYSINGSAVWSGSYAPFTRTTSVVGFNHSVSDASANYLKSFRVESPGYVDQTLLDGPIAYWEMGNGSVEPDRSGFGHNITWTSATPIAKGIAPHVSGATFNGSQDGALTVSSYWFGTRCIEAIVAPTDNTLRAVMSWRVAYQHYAVYNSTDGIHLLTGTSTGTSTTNLSYSGANLNDGMPHHVVAQWSDTEAWIYVDGIQALHTSISYDPGSVADTINIASEDGGRRWLGDMGHLAFYGTMLDPTRIAAKAAMV